MAIETEETNEQTHKPPNRKYNHHYRISFKVRWQNWRGLTIFSWPYEKSLFQWVYYFPTCFLLSHSFQKSFLSKNQLVVHHLAVLSSCLHDRIRFPCTLWDRHGHVTEFQQVQHWDLAHIWVILSYFLFLFSKRKSTIYSEKSMHKMGRSMYGRESHNTTQLNFIRCKA
jgi:hypothetical protein